MLSENENWPNQGVQRDIVILEDNPGGIHMQRLYPKAQLNSVLHVFGWFVYHFNRKGNRSHNKPSVKKMIHLLHYYNENTVSL